MKKILILVLALLLIGCGTSESAVQTAIAETEAAKPTFTYTVLSTDTPTATPSPTFTLTPSDTPTETPSPTVTETPTPTETLTPTPDLRVIVGEPEDFVLESDDFPDKYFLRAGDSTPHLNSEILGARGTEDGKKYLEATGRIGGWIIWHDRGSDIVIAPEFVRSYVVMYETINGPLVAKSPEYDSIYDDFEEIDMELNLGDWNRVTINKERQPNGKYFVWYALEFVYRNVWAEVMGIGFESDIDHDYIENLARIMLDKLENAELKNP